MATTGYRARFDIALYSNDPGARTGLKVVERVVSLEPGPLHETGALFDLAIEGGGFFVLGSEAGPVYTRNGQFRRDASGRLLGVGGLPLQADGGDVIVPEEGVAITRDGVIQVSGEPTMRLQLVDLDQSGARLGDDGLMRADGEDVTPLSDVSVRQGYLEGSNVSLGQEMVALMEAVRRAETGQRLMNVYDDLLGRVATTLGGSGA